MLRLQPRSTRTYTLFPYTTLFLSVHPLPAHDRPVRVRLRLPALLRLPGARPARLLDADLRGDRQAPLHHCRLQRVAAAVAAVAHLHPGLDPAPGPQLGPAAQAGVRRRRARGAALLVAGRSEE